MVLLLRWFLSRLRAENVRSEVTHVTGIVKYLRKSVFRYRNVEALPLHICVAGSYGTPAHSPSSAA